MANFWLPVAQRDDRKALRQFGIGFSVLFSVLVGTGIAIWQTGSVSVPLILLGGIVLLVAITIPLALYWPYRAWMVVASILNFINTRIILGLAFFGIILPVGLVMRIRGGLSYQRCPEAKDGSYWQRCQSSPEVSNLKEPF